MEKRNDIGLKVGYFILTAVIGIVLSLFFNKTFSIAENAAAMGYENSKDIAILKTEYKNIDIRLVGIDNKLDKLLKVVQ